MNCQVYSAKLSKKVVCRFAKKDCFIWLTSSLAHEVLWMMDCDGCFACKLKSDNDIGCFFADV